MKIEANTIEELIEKSGEQKETMIFLDALLQKLVPQLKRQLFKGSSITMIGYGEMPWETKSKSGIWPLISLAPQKGSANLYIAGNKEGTPLLALYGKQLGRVSTGKSCIRVKKTENLNIGAFEDLVQDALDYYETKKNEYGRDCASPAK